VHFLSHGYPAEVLTLGDESFLVRHADTPDDLLSRQVFHDLGARVAPAEAVAAP